MTAADVGPACVRGCLEACYRGLARIVAEQRISRRPRTYDIPAAGDLGLLPEPEVSTAVLDFLQPCELVPLIFTSTWCRSRAESEDVWHRACLRAWADKQHSAQMRHWLSEQSPPPGRPAGNDGRTPTGSEESWKARYALALQDRHRTRILPEELCWDSARDAEGRPLPRRWRLTIHLGRWVDKEVIFSPGGGSPADFDFRVLNFRVFQEIPWRPHGSSDIEGDGDLDFRAGHGVLEVPDGVGEEEEEDDEDEEEDEEEEEEEERPPEEEDEADEAQDEDRFLGADGRLGARSWRRQALQGGHESDTDGSVESSEDEDQVDELSQRGANSTRPRTLEPSEVARLGRTFVGDRPLLRHSLAFGGRRAASEAAAAVAAAAGWVDGRGREMLPQPRFLRPLRPPPPPLLIFGRRFADGPFFMPLPRPLAAVPLPSPPQVPRRRRRRCSSGCSLLQVPSLPFLLRVGRTEDWGWSLAPVQAEGAAESPRDRAEGRGQRFGHVGRQLRFSSRQLSRSEHEHAWLTPSATFTLYMKAVEGCRSRGIQGQWECFDGFQGTMHAPTWAGSCISFEINGEQQQQPAEQAAADAENPRQLSGICRIHFAEGNSIALNLSFRATEDACQLKEGHLDLFVGQLGQGQPCYWLRGEDGPQPENSRGAEEVPQAELSPLVLVLTMGMFFGTGHGPVPAPSRIPPGLPTLEAAFATSLAGPSVNGAQPAASDQRATG